MHFAFPDSNIYIFECFGSAVIIAFVAVRYILNAEDGLTKTAIAFLLPLVLRSLTIGFLVIFQ